MGSDFEFKISPELERDVWFFSKRFNLNRMTFRIVMKSPIVCDQVHRLNYKSTTAIDLYHALEPGYRFSVSEQNVIGNVNYVSKNAILNCMNRLLRFQDEKGNDNEEFNRDS